MTCKVPQKIGNQNGDRSGKLLREQKKTYQVFQGFNQIKRISDIVYKSYNVEDIELIDVAVQDLTVIVLITIVIKQKAEV